jgi:hypothetical protein
MPHLKTDVKRKLRHLIEMLEAALETRNVSIQFEEWRGTWTGDAEATGVSWVDGGEWDPLSGDYLNKAEKPAVTLKVQEQQLPALQSTAQFMAVFGGQRSGKTFVGRQIALRTLLRPNTIVFYLLPRFRKQGFVLDGLLNVLDSQGWIHRRNKNEHRYQLVTGSVLQCFSAADKRSEEAFLGGECDLAILEEFREMPDRVFGKLFSRVLSRNGRMVIVTSPEAGHMIEEIDRGEWAERVSFDVHRLDVRRNFLIYDKPPREGKQDIIEIARKLYDPRRFARDVEGRNVAEEGADFYNWDPETHVIDKPPGVPCTEMLWQSDDLWLSKDRRWTGPGTLDPDPNLLQCRLVGLDFGAALMSGLECIVTVEGLNPGLAGDALTYENTNLVVVQEHVKTDTSVLDFVQTVLMPAGLTPKRAVLFCDPSGHARDHVIGQSPIDMLSKKFGYQVFHKPGGSLRKPGIDAVRIRLHMHRLFVLRRCKGLIKDLPKIRTIGETARKASNDPHGHRPDALRYIVDNVWPVRELFVKDASFDVAKQAYSS